ncbi:MAG: hypothetical protein WC325_00125 [Candidatus Bathyarchaeia archaeon]
MNKMLAYVTVAILLGTVTLLVPLTLVGNYQTNPEGSYNLSATDQENSQNNITRNDGTLQDPKATSNETEYPSPPGVLTVGNTEEPTDFSPLAWMTLPSLGVALAVFVYLKRRIQ